MCWSSGTVYSLTRLALCPSRSLSLVCKIPISLLGLSETNTIGYICYKSIPLPETGASTYVVQWNDEPLPQAQVSRAYPQHQCRVALTGGAA